MYRMILRPIIIAIAILTLCGYGGVASADNSSVVQLPIQKETKIKVVKIEYVQNNSKVFIPQVRGMENVELQAKVNNNLEEAILSLANSSANSSLNGDTEVSLYRNNLLGLHFIGDSFTSGTPHPNKIDCGIHVDLTTGIVYKLADLFKPGANFAERIHELCKTNERKYRMKKEGLGDGWTYRMFAGSWTKEQGTFLLLDDSLRVYSIPSNATGAISGYNVPYTDLMDIINTDGKLWQQLKNGEKNGYNTIDEQFTFDNALRGVENTNAWLRSFRTLTQITADRITPEEKLQVGNLGVDMQSIGFYNWVKSLEGTLRKQNYDICRLEYELALERLAVGKVRQDEVNEKEKKYQEASRNMREFLRTFHIAD